MRRIGVICAAPFRVAIDEKAGTQTFRKPPEVRVSGTSGTSGPAPVQTTNDGSTYHCHETLCRRTPAA